MAQETFGCASSDVKSVDTSQNGNCQGMGSKSKGVSKERGLKEKLSKSRAHGGSKSHNLKASKEKVHSMNIHGHESTSDLKTESKNNEEYGEYIHELIDGRIPREKETSEAIARLEKLEMKSKDNNNVEMVNNVKKLKSQKENIVINVLKFESNDKKKIITPNDICSSISSAKNVLKTLFILIDKGEEIVNNELHNKIVKFVFNQRFRIFLYVYTKDEMKSMPCWCINENTKRGMSQYIPI